MNTNIYTSRISKATDPVKLATSLVLLLKNYNAVDLVGIGQSSTYIMVKSVAIARGFLNQSGMADLQIIPHITVVKDSDGKDLTGFVFRAFLPK